MRAKLPAPAPSLQGFAVASSTRHHPVRARQNSVRQEDEDARVSVAGDGGNLLGARTELTARVARIEGPAGAETARVGIRAGTGFAGEVALARVPAALIEVAGAARRAAR